MVWCVPSPVLLCLFFLVQHYLQLFFTGAIGVKYFVSFLSGHCHSVKRLNMGFGNHWYAISLWFGFVVFVWWWVYCLFILHCHSDTFKLFCSFPLCIFSHDFPELQAVEIGWVKYFCAFHFLCVLPNDLLSDKRALLV